LGFAIALAADVAAAACAPKIYCGTPHTRKLSTFSKTSYFTVYPCLEFTTSKVRAINLTTNLTNPDCRVGAGISVSSTGATPALNFSCDLTTLLPVGFDDLKQGINGLGCFWGDETAVTSMHWWCAAPFQPLEAGKKYTAEAFDWYDIDGDD